MSDTTERYADLAMFVRVLDRGGFSAAARDLGVSTSRVSRGVARLEARLHTRLLHRTTRRLSATEAGRALHARAATLLAELDEAEAAVVDVGGEIRGTLRVTAPVQFGLRYVAPLAAAFAARHPALRLDLVYDDRRVDLVAEGFDLAVRAGALGDSSLVARRLGVTRLLTVAAPAYLAARGVPTRPADLGDHDVLVYGHDASASILRFSGPEGEVAVRVRPRVVVNHVEGLLAPALAGLGVARIPDAIAAPDLRARRLARVLEAWEQDAPIAAVYPPGRHLSPRVRAFVDHLVARLAQAPWRDCDPDCAPGTQDARG